MVGAVFGEVGESLFMAVAVFDGEFLRDSRDAKRSSLQ